VQPGILIDQLRLNWRRPAASIVRHWPPGTQLLELPNALVRVRSVGSGDRTILLTPDAPVVLENYTALIECLAPHARVICFEFPGCGFSFPRFGFGFTLSDYVGVTKGVMDALQIERATPAFTCVNAMVAMAFARRYPDRVDNLILSQVASVPEMHAFVQRIDIRVSGMSMFRTPVVGQLFMALKRAYVAHGWFKIALPKGFPADAIWTVAKPAYDAGCDFCLASLVQGQSSIVPQDVAIGRRPVTVFWGDADRTHFKTNKESIREPAPGAVSHHLPDRGHCLDIETPEEFSRLLLAAM
jgi:pimeloyl-ACP methyl ester carboxylesterase